MPKLLLALVAALLLVPAAAAARISKSDAAILAQMNRVRAARGLGPLRLDTRLERAARAHSREMLAANVFRHGAFDRRMLRFDIRGTVAGENLAWGTGYYATARAVIDAWLASPAHRANLLRPTFTRVGVGSLVGAFQGNRDARVVTADFAG